MTLKGEILVNSKLAFEKKVSFLKVKTILEVKNCDCLIINSLHPDFAMAIPVVDFIITQKGSALSHLAVLCREYGRSIIIAKDSLRPVPAQGDLLVRKGKNGEVIIEI